MYLLHWLCMVLHFAGTTGQADQPAGTPQEPVIIKYDMTGLHGWNLNNLTTRRRYFDETQLVTSLQGLANRHEPRLYVRYNAAHDDFWWARMTEPGGWLRGRTVQNATSIQDLLNRLADVHTGVVVWDERVPATANLASTIAGCDGLLALRYDANADSLYQQLVLSGPKLPVQVRLMKEDGGVLFTGRGIIPDTSLPSSGSAKCDAYLWLVEHYLKTGRTDPKRLGYYLDGYWLQSWTSAERTNHTLNNHDFVIARRGLVFDLNVWNDETPVDDRGQAPGTDANTLKTILRAAYEQMNGNGMIHVAGFVPWAYKYTNWASAGGTHEPVPTEWRYAEILSCFNAYMDADAISLANMANASFFQHYPLADAYPQNNKPTRESLIARGVLDAEGRIKPLRYVAHYVGDYDAAAWLYQKLPAIWMDAQRGSEPLSWAFNPNLCERFPLGLAWTRQTATANDTFVAGDSGAGYVNPRYLSPPRPFSNLPSGVAAWEAHCRRFFDQWDISAVGFVIDGYAPCMNQEVMDSYARVAPDGIVPQKVPLQGTHNGMPFTRMRWDLSGSPSQAVDAIETFLNRPLPQFDVFRSILQTPTWYKQVGDELRRRRGEEVMVVDLYSLLWLVREFEQHPELYLWPQSPYGGAAAVLAKPQQQAGLAPVPVADGPITVVQQGGRSAWQVEAGRFLYFSVDDAFHRRNQQLISVTVEYYDQGSGVFEVQYDASDYEAPHCGIFKSTGAISRTSSNTWRTRTWALPQARFANAQNGGADLRVYSNASNLRISEVRLFYVDTGSVRVTLEPEEAAAVGARWRLSSGPDTAWRASGELVEDVPLGGYTVNFKSIRFWEPPTDVAVNVVRGTTEAAGTYIRLQPGDLDDDGDVDQEDFGRFQACMTGPGFPQTGSTCTEALMDADDDVDQADFSIFQGCLSGANVPGEIDCAE